VTADATDSCPYFTTLQHISLFLLALWKNNAVATTKRVAKTITPAIRPFSLVFRNPSGVF